MESISIYNRVRMVTVTRALTVLAAAAAGCLSATGPVADSAATIPASSEAAESRPRPAPRAQPVEGGRVFYVAPTGSDDAAGTLNAPWQTLSKSIASLEAGDTLYVRGGTYSEKVAPEYRSGTAARPITVQAYPGERPVLSGLLRIKDADYWIFDGLNVTWNDAIGTRTDHMVKITNGVGWTFKNAEIWDARSYAGLLVAGTVTGQPSDWTVRNNAIHDIHPTNKANQDHCIYANTGLSAGPGVIEQNLLYNAPNGEGIKLGPPGEEGGSANVTIRYNTIYNTSQSLLLAYDTRNIEIYGNMFVRTHGKYGHMRGYRLRGAGNVAHNNIGYSARSMFLNDPGFPGIRDAGGNAFPVDPQFDRFTPDGFNPANERARRFGARVERMERLTPPVRQRAATGR